jgi:uncharacterized membrane protein
MKKSRLEAFSDGVLAIIITIMVLDLKVPHEATLAALAPLWPTLLSYVLSFIFIGIYWNNHHHLWQVVEAVTGPVLWANLHLLFWLSLVPFATAWMGENQFAAAPVAVYGVVLLGAGAAYYVMTRVLLASHARDSLLARAGPRFQGPHLHRLLPGRDRRGFSLAVVRRRALCTGGHPLARTGPAHREGAQGLTARIHRSIVYTRSALRAMPTSVLTVQWSPIV